MMILIVGGSRSGKSEYAELRVCELSSERVYIAAAEVHDEEMRRRAELHQARRNGMNFTTIERARNLGDLELPSDACVLIESLSVWTANEMFTQEGVNHSVGKKIYSDLLKIRDKVKDIVIVSDDVFCDGREYDSLTEEWLKTLGELHIKIAALADEVTEIIAGLPVMYKPSQKLQESLPANSR